MTIGNSLRNILETSQFKEFVSIDVETTGLNPTTDSILQVGAIKFDLSGNIIDQYEHLFYPEGNYIPLDATEIHGITLEKVKGYPTYKCNSSKI